MIQKFPILIVATPRTGSTSLLHHISSKYNIYNIFNEPNIQTTHWISVLTSFMNRKIPFVVKLMSKHVPMVENIENYYIIKLSRKNHIEQCVSMYIARKLNIWERTSEEKNEFYIEIDTELIIDSIREIKIAKKDFDNLPINADLSLFYEDLEFSGSNIIKNPLPSNIFHIRQTVINFYDNVQF